MGVAESDAVEEAEIPRVKQCQDNSGSPRAVGDVWKVECNTCRCTDTVVAACTLRLCNFNLGGEQCRDKDGVSRSVGEEWKEGFTGAPRRFAQRSMVALAGLEKRGRKVNSGLCRGQPGITSASAARVSYFASLNPKRWRPQ